MCCDMAAPRPVLGPTQHHTKWVLVYFGGVKWPEHEANYKCQAQECVHLDDYHMSSLRSGSSVKHKDKISFYMEFKNCIWS